MLRSVATTARGASLFALLVALPSSSAALTMAEVAECRATADLFELEMAGGVVLEMAFFAYAVLVMHVLIEEWYVPALELVTSPDVLDVPRPLLGSTIMAAGNCLPELSMSLAALVFSESQDIGTGEVFGSCVFDLLGILGVVALRAPPGDEGIQLAPPLVVYFLAWVAIGVRPPARQLKDPSPHAGARAGIASDAEPRGAPAPRYARGRLSLLCRLGDDVARKHDDALALRALRRGPLPCLAPRAVVCRRGRGRAAGRWRAEPRQGSRYLARRRRRCRRLEWRFAHRIGVRRALRAVHHRLDERRAVCQLAE